MKCYNTFKNDLIDLLYRKNSQKGKFMSYGHRITFYNLLFWNNFRTTTTSNLLLEINLFLPKKPNQT